MNVDYYNVINQLTLVNNWCIVTKLYKYYMKTDPELIDNLNIAKFFIRYGFNNMNLGMKNAAYNNHFSLVKFFIEKGANNWNMGMAFAAKNNHITLVKFFIEKGADYWNWGMSYAAKNNHIELIKFFVEKGAYVYQDCYNYTSSQEIKDYLQQFL